MGWHRHADKSVLAASLKGSCLHQSRLNCIIEATQGSSDFCAFALIGAAFGSPAPESVWCLLPEAPATLEKRWFFE